MGLGKTNVKKKKVHIVVSFYSSVISGLGLGYFGSFSSPYRKATG